MSRQAKASILISLVFTDPYSKLMIQAEADRDDPVIDLRYEMALNRKRGRDDKG